MPSKSYMIVLFRGLVERIYFHYSSTATVKFYSECSNLKYSAFIFFFNPLFYYSAPSPIQLELFCFSMAHITLATRTYLQKCENVGDKCDYIAWSLLTFWANEVPYTVLFNMHMYNTKCASLCPWATGCMIFLEHEHCSFHTELNCRKIRLRRM